VKLVGNADISLLLRWKGKSLSMHRASSNVELTCGY
jgi:hypothetical protein